MFLDQFPFLISSPLQVLEPSRFRLFLFPFVLSDDLVTNLSLHLVNLLLVHFVNYRLEVLLVNALIQRWYRRYYTLHLRIRQVRVLFLEVRLH